MISARLLLNRRGLFGLTLGHRYVSSCAHLFRLRRPRVTLGVPKYHVQGSWNCGLPKYVPIRIQRKCYIGEEFVQALLPGLAKITIDMAKGAVEKLVNSTAMRSDIPITTFGFTERKASTKEVLKTFRRLKKRRRRPYHPVAVFLQDEPGSGKTQLACEFAIRYLRQHHTKTIGWVNAADKASTIKSLRDIALVLNKEEAEKMEAHQSGMAEENTRDGKLLNFRNLVRRELKKQPDWLLIIDDLTSHSPQQYLPLGRGPGDSEWGSGLVLVTTREKQSVRDVNKEKAVNKYMAVIDNCRMTMKEASDLLMSLSGVPKKKKKDEDDGITTLANKLECHPFSLEMAGAYINTARQLPGGSKYGFHDYLRDYEKDFRKVTATSLLTRKSGSGVKMRFDQFTNMSELGEKYERLFMVLACSKSWKDVVPIPVVARILKQHPQRLTLNYVHENTMITQCALLRRDDSVRYNTGVKQQEDSPSPSEVVQDNVESVYLCHPLAHDEARNLYGLGDDCTKSELTDLMKETVRDAIIALNDEYLDAVQLESASAFTIRRLTLPLTEAFLEVAEKFDVPLESFDKALAKATLGDALVTFVTPERGRRLLLEAQKILEEHQHNRNLTAVRVRTLLATAHRQLGDADGSVGELETVLSELNEFQLPDRQDTQLLYGDTHVDLGMAYTHLGRYSRAQELFQKGLKTFESLPPQDEELQKAIRLKIARCLSKIGMTKRKLVTGDLGESDFEKARKIQEELKSPDIPFTLGNLAIIYRERGTPKDLTKSSQYLEEALQIEERHYGRMHMSVATTKSHLSIIRRRQGEMDEALKLAEDALEISKYVHGQMKAFHPGIASCLSAVARTKRDLGLLEDAREAFAESLKINEEIYGKYHHKVIAQRVGLASVYRHMGLPKKAEPLLKHTLERCQKVQTKEQEARCHRVLAHVYEMLDQPKEAAHHWNAALRMYEDYEKPRGVTRTSQVAVCRAHLAYLQKDLNSPQRDDAIFDELLEPYYRYERTGDKPHSAEMLHVHYVFGKLKLRTHFYSEAVEIFDRVERGQGKFLGTNHPRLVVTLTAQSAALVGLYKEKKDTRLLDKADTCLEKAKTIVEKKLSDNHLLAAEVHSNRGFVLCERHSFARTDVPARKAVEEFDEALAIREKALGQDNRKYAKSLAGKSRAMYYLEQFDEAMQCAQQAKQYFENSRAKMLTVAADDVTGTMRRVSIDNELEDLNKLISNIKGGKRVSGYQD